MVCCDLDGVLWRGDAPIPGAAEGVATLRAEGIRVVFATNNSSGTRAEYAAKLVGFGVPATADDVLSSAMAAAQLVASYLSPNARVLACSGPGVREALEVNGLVPVDAEPAEAVVVGWHRDFDFDRLARRGRRGARRSPVRRHQHRPDVSERERCAAGQRRARRRGRNRGGP